MHATAPDPVTHHATHALRAFTAAALVSALLSACAGERALGPDVRATRALAAVTAADAGRGPELGACDQLRAPEGSVLVSHLYARGVQIYRWTGASWAFEGPSAALYASPRFNGQVGTHSAGPRWVHRGGSTVYGSSPVACPVDANAIPWLLLTATPDAATGGIFSRVTAIQRVNTTGGRMPAGPGSTPGEVREVPYTAEYYFYR